MSDALDAIAERYLVEEDFDSVLASYEVGLICERKRGELLLELGCGDGVMTRGFQAAFSRIVAVDGSDICVERARANAPSALIMHSMLEDFETLERFTDITLIRVLEHLENPVELLRRAVGWLRPGGRIHVIVPNAMSLNRQLGVAMGLMPHTHHLHERDIAHGHKRVYDAVELMVQIRDANLVVQKTDGIMLKPLSNDQMEAWDPAIIGGLFRLGHQLPELATELYVTCSGDR